MREITSQKSLVDDPSIVFRSGDQAVARYASGRLVYDEQFKDGRLTTRYWSTSGQIWPEMHVEKTSWEIGEPADSFQVSINGKALAGGYQWVGAELLDDASGYRAGKLPVLDGVITLIHKEVPVEIKVHTRVDGGPFLIRWLEITNISDESLAITAVSPFSGMLWKHRVDEHLPSIDDAPFEAAYTHSFQWGEEGDFWFEPLKDGVTNIDGGKLGRSGWGRPAFWARNRCNGQTVVCELAWGGNYSFSLDSRTCVQRPWMGVTAVERNASLFFNMGLSGMDYALRVIAPDETVRTPPVHLAVFQEDTDAIIQATHEHVRSVVLPEPIAGREVEIEGNHRGYLCDRENEPDLIQDVELAASVGVEMYVIDAGWYGNNQKNWATSVGDWHAGSWLPNGLEPVAEHAHACGMTFGLWAEIEASGSESNLIKEHPEWSLTRNGEPIVGGRALDVSNPDVATWIRSEIERMILQYNLDMYRIDHNHTIDPAGNRQIKGFTEDLTWRYYEALYGIFERLHAQFPGVVFQNCAGGGGRLDWGTMHRFNNTELSDWMRLPRGLRILYGVTVSLPPEILLRTFGTESGELALEGDIDAQLRMVMMSRPILRGIAPSLETLSPFLRDKIQRNLELHRDFIRPVMVGGKIYHHTPFTPMTKPMPWCVMEYATNDCIKSVTGVFKTSEHADDTYILKPRGIDQALTYTVTLDNLHQSYTISGRELAQNGIIIKLERTLSSELLLIEAN